MNSKIKPSDMNNRKSKTDLTQPTFCSSAFTLTFVLEVVELDVWHDCNEGWIDLGPPLREVRLIYQLLPEYTFEVNTVIWPHVAKVFSGSNYGWVRTWQFLERRWLTFSIRHVIPVRVTELRNYVTTIVPSLGAGALSSKFNSKLEKTEVYLPPLRFGERRQFAEVIEADCPLEKYIGDTIWSLVVNYIPSSIMDGLLETPYPVEDVRHQDAVIYQVQDVILNHRHRKDENMEVRIDKRKQSNKEQAEKLAALQKNNYEIKLPGDWILAGIGRVTPFVSTGDCPTQLGEVIALISCTNLPAQDDFPTFFVNVCNLTDVPLKHLKQNRFTHIYTRWRIRDEERNSEKQSLPNEPGTEVNFNDHHSVPLPSAAASDLMATFLDEPFRVEVRGIRIPPPKIKKMKFFGYEKGDRGCGRSVPPPIPNQDVDILIAHTRIDARALTKINGFIKGEFPLYPPQTSVEPLEREEICTNDVNAIRGKVKPDLFIQPGVILEAQMMIEVSMGLVGCKPKSNAERYSRLHCLISDREAIMTLLRQISEINDSVMQTESTAGLLTGFALDTGDTVMLYVEGPKEGQVLRVWERAEDFYPTVKPVFSSSAKYSCRLYPELLLAAMPFNIMKMSVPLSVLLSLTPIYVRPALPLPTRSAVLKIGRLVASKFKTVPCYDSMPTATELKSFRLELCVAPRPPIVYSVEIPKILPDIAAKDVASHAALDSSSLQDAVKHRGRTRKINWHQKERKYSSNTQIN